MFREDRKTRTIENPLHFTDLRAKELKGQLDWAARELGVRERIPRIEAVVFLSAETLRCEFDETQRQRVYGLDDGTKQTGLPGVWADFLDQPPASERNRVTPPSPDNHLVATLGWTTLRPFQRDAIEPVLRGSDTPASRRQSILADPPDLLLTTPESLESMLVGVSVDHRRLFTGLRAVTVDEVHAFGTGDRGWHLLAVLERLTRIAGRPFAPGGAVRDRRQPGRAGAVAAGVVRGEKARFRCRRRAGTVR